MTYRKNQNRRKDNNKTQNIRCLLLLATFVAIPAHASVWIESNDPFLRASLHKLSDNQLLQAPISSYPLRWSIVGDDVTQAHTSEKTRYAQQHVRHTMNNARFARGNVMAKVIYQSNPQAQIGYGSVGNDHWGIYSSYDHIDDDFSFRLSINYADSMDPNAKQSGTESQYDTGVNFKGSHLSFNAGAALVSLGYLERWWGPTWQHNLQQANFGETEPSLQVSWMGNPLPVFGFWNLDSAINYVVQESSYTWLTRLTAKPLKTLEFGLNYQLSDKDDNGDELASYGVDGRLSLPAMSQLSHALYVHWQSINFGQDTTAINYGWEAQFNAFATDMTLVLEAQSVDEQDRDVWTGSQQELLNRHSSVLWGDSYSMALYALLSNDHRMSFVYRDSKSERTQESVTQIDYYIPFQQGMFSVGVGYVDYISPKKSIDEPNFIFGYEYRY